MSSNWGQLGRIQALTQKVKEIDQGAVDANEKRLDRLVQRARAEAEESGEEVSRGI